MKNGTIIIYFLLLITSAIGAQDQDTLSSKNGQDSYDPLQCTGKIPKSFVTPSSVKYEKELERIQKSAVKRKDKNRQKKFSLESNFVLDDLMQSGKVLFNDEVTIYLNAVVRQLLEVQPLSGKQQVQVYALRSTAVNAFATDRGDIFVTLGLLAQLENEAQLAYILSHELVHIEEKHAISMYIQSMEVDDSKRSSVFNNSVFDQKVLAKCAFSKEQENTADKKGIDRFLKTNYHTGTLPTVFDVLKYSYLPFDEVAFDRGILQGGNYRFPEEFWLKSVNPIKGEDDTEDDSKSSHPNLGHRREALNSVLESVKNDNKTNYIVSETAFMSARRRCRMELPMLYLHNDLHPQAVYNAFLLLKKHPDDLYLQKCILKALYIFAKMANDDDFNLDANHEKVEGEMQQVFHLFEKMPEKQTCLMALRYGWQLQQRFPENTEIKAINEDLFVETAKLYDLNEFRKQPDSEAPQSDPIVADTSKYAKIRQQKEDKFLPGGEEYWRYAFSEWKDDDSFKAAFETGEKLAEEDKQKQEDYKKNYKKYKKEAKKEKRHGAELGINRVAIINPFYLKLDERKDNAVQFVRTEEGQEHYRKMLGEVSKMTDLKVDILDVTNLKEKDGSDAFNDIRFMNEWFAEQIHHYDLTLTPGLEQERINAIAQKYNTDYFLWTGVVSMRQKSKHKAIKICLGVLNPIILPVMLYSAFKPEQEMLYYAILYDVKTGKRKVINFDSFDNKDSDAIIKAHLFDTFSQIRKK